jgi:hypothetical protein
VVLGTIIIGVLGLELPIILIVRLKVNSRFLMRIKLHI